MTAKYRNYINPKLNEAICAYFDDYDLSVRTVRYIHCDQNISIPEEKTTSIFNSEKTKVLDK